MLHHLHGENFISLHTTGIFLAATSGRVTPCPLLGIWERGWVSSLSHQPNSASPACSTAQPPTAPLFIPPVGPGWFLEQGSPDTSLLIPWGGGSEDPREAVATGEAGKGSFLGL